MGVAVTMEAPSQGLNAEIEVLGKRGGRRLRCSLASQCDASEGFSEGKTIGRGQGD